MARLFGFWWGFLSPRHKNPLVVPGCLGAQPFGYLRDALIWERRLTKRVAMKLCVRESIGRSIISTEEVGSQLQ